MTTARSADGVTIVAAEAGSGPPLVLVHGTGADHGRWAPVLPALAAQFTVHCMERRGRGESGDGADYRIEREFEDVKALVDAIGEPVALLGHSHGAICALEATLLTSNVQKLVLYEPPIATDAAVHPASVIERLQGLLDAGDREGVVTTFFGETVRMPASELARLRSLPNWPARVAAAHTIPRELRADEDYRFDAARFSNLRVPTLLLLGGESPPFFETALARIEQAMPSSHITVLPGQRHTAMNSAPELFVSEVVAFLRG